MPLDRRAERLLAMLAATQGPADAPETPAARRAALAALAHMADDASAPADVRDLFCPGPAGDIPLRLYAPPNTGGAILTGLNSSARNTPIACDQSTPEVADPAGAIN